LEVFVEDTFGVQKALLNMFWEHLPYSTIIASVPPVDEENFFKWMTVSLGSSLASDGICLLVDLWEVQPCLGDPE